METQPLSPNGGRAPSPIFGPFLLWLNGWMHQDATWYGCRPQPRRLCVRWGPSPLPTKGVEPPPQFSAHICCGQMAAWIKMSLGMEQGLGPGDFVVHGGPDPRLEWGNFEAGRDVPLHTDTAVTCAKTSNTKSPGLRPTSMPSTSFIHPAVWLQ